MERANRPLRDRLVKEMRLRGIDGMAADNAYLPEFMADFNRRFAVAPRNAEDALRSLRSLRARSRSKADPRQSAEGTFLLCRKGDISTLR